MLWKYYDIMEILWTSMNAGHPMKYYEPPWHWIKIPWKTNLFWFKWSPTAWLPQFCIRWDPHTAGSLAVMLEVAMPHHIDSTANWPGTVQESKVMSWKSESIERITSPKYSWHQRSDAPGLFDEVILRCPMVQFQWCYSSHLESRLTGAISYTRWEIAS